MGHVTQMSDAELEVMGLIWENHGEMRFGSIMAELEQRGRSWKANTVITFLTRLVEKNMLRVEKQGRLNVYHAAMSETEYLEGLTQSFVRKVYGGDAKGLVAALLRKECLSKQDIDEVQAFWEEAKHHD